MPRPTRQDFPDFSKEANATEQFFKALPRLAGNMALNFYNDSWSRQGYVNARYQSWAKRKNPDADGRFRRILVKSGNLRRSLKMNVNGNQVAIYSDLPYAQIHNEGGRVSGTVNIRAHLRKTPSGKRVVVKSHSRNVNFEIPQRQFMDIPGKAMSPFLEKRIVAHVERTLNKLYRNAT